MAEVAGNGGRLIYFERWAHPSALDLLADRPQIDVTRLAFDDDEEHVSGRLAEAHVYQIWSTRDELPLPYHCTPAFLDRCPDLLAVSAWGAGYDTVDVDACTERGVIVVNQSGGNKEAVAEHALAMMVSLFKHIEEASRNLRAGWTGPRETYMGRDLFEKTLGIVGLGNIGTRMAEIARVAFHMRVLAYDPYVDADTCAARGTEKVDLQTLLSESDVVTVHCPLTADSRDMINAAAYQTMKPGALFINTARGGIHDEAALYDALASGHLAGAGLDVWSVEPPPADHPLLSLDNVIASPHTAGVTDDARRRVVAISIDQIVDILEGRRPPRLINPDAWSSYSQRFETIFGKSLVD
jgi:D-3-phosphoglycerate dehydrogenase